eukprot:m.128535 g.128535  ORF g.128535 m.128535 type:complete len:95 (-) comp29341_c0_seq2:1329-1613(-)
MYMHVCVTHTVCIWVWVTQRVLTLCVCDLRCCVVRVKTVATKLFDYTYEDIISYLSDLQRLICWIRLNIGTITGVGQDERSAFVRRQHRLELAK